MSAIRELEKTELTLLQRRRLIRCEYWQSEVERRFGGTDMPVQDRQRLYALQGLLEDRTDDGAQVN
jgi:hypothetical protein